MFEELVRPAAAPGSLATRLLPSNNVQVQVTRARLIWGTAGTLPGPTVESGGGFKVEECDTGFTETKRTTSNLRVENPDDPTQYVIIQRIESVAFDGKPRKKIVGSIVSETTAFAEFDPFAGSPFGDVPQGQDGCQSTYTFHNPTT